MGDASGDSKHQHGAPEQSSSGSGAQEEFISQVRILKEAEKSAAARIEEARKQAAQIEASAREQAVEIAGKAQQKAVEAKNEILARKREEADAEIHRILDAARKQAGTIKAKRLTDTDVSSLAKSVQG